MRTIAICLVLSFLFGCRREPGDPNSRGSNSVVERQNAISRLLKDRDPSYPYAFDIRGPLTLRQLEEELMKDYAAWRKRVGDSVGTFQDSALGEEYARLKDKYREGDELYFFKSDARSWNELHGNEGYVLVRQNAIVHIMMRSIS